MTLVLIHFGEKIPYAEQCVSAIKKVSNIVIHWIAEYPIEGVESFDINKYSMDDYCAWFNGHNNFLRCSGDLWNYSLQRFYILYLHCYAHSLESVLHIENDQVVYYDPLGIGGILKKSDKLLALDLGPKYASGAIMYFSNIGLLYNMNQEINKCLIKGDAWIKKTMNLCEIEVSSEMVILKYLLMNNIIKSLPLFPEDSDEYGYIFDPASYGQYFGGTPAGHSPGTLFEHHYIGKRIKETNEKLSMIRGKPYFNDTPIFNLHIHTKKLQDFIQ